MKKLFLKFVCLFIISFNITFSQNVKFDATVSSNQVAQGDRIELQFTLQNAQGIKFSAPTFKGFQVLTGPNTSQSIQFINGRQSSSVSYSYILQAQEIGTFTIDPASIVVDGKKILSNSVKITVTKGSPKQQQQQNQQNQDEGKMSKQADEIIKKNIFITLNVNKSQAYLGEPIIATYKLYVNPQLQVQLGQPKMPTFNGFWSQDFDNKEIKYNREVLDGVVYNSAEIKKVVLLPQQAGNLVIEPMSIDAVARLVVQGQQKKKRGMFDDFFDDPFFNQNYKDFQVTISSKKTNISVKNLPDNSPSSFNNAVGDLQLKAWIDKTNARTGDAITLKIQISGSGNLKLIEPIPINFPPDFDVYDPKIIDNVSITSSGMSGSKTFEYYIIPKNAGEYRINPVEFTYFNLSQKSFVTLKSDEFNIKVQQGTGGDSKIIAGVKKEDIKYIGKDILFIKSNHSGFTTGGRNFHNSVFYYILLFTPLILFFIAFFYKRKNDKLHGNVTLLRNKRANSIAKKRLKTAKKYLDQKNEQLFYDEITRGIWGYLSDKLTIPVSELTIDSIIDELNKRNIDDKIITNLNETINYCEYARFAPSAEKKPLNTVYDNSALIISELEGVIR